MSYGGLTELEEGEYCTLYGVVTATGLENFWNYNI